MDRYEALSAVLGLAAIATVLLLSSCAVAPPLPPSACPTPVAYSREFQQRWADELRQAADASAFARISEDYIAERAKLRACL